MAGAERVLREFEESIDQSLATTRLNVVVMGPGLEDTSTAAALRRALIALAKEYGTTVQPEHRGLEEASKKKLGAGHHLTYLEAHLVKVSQLVVLIPDSAGSLCELGYFSMQPRAAAKMLLLANRKHPRHGSYVADGPVEAARQNGARIAYVDYADVDGCWAVVRTRIQEVRAAEALRNLDPGSTDA